MLLLAGAAGAALAYILRPSSGRVGNSAVPQPAKPVDLDRYLGRWYELGRIENRFERGCEGVTADYTARPDGLVEVVNACHEETPEGLRRLARGRAKVVPGSRNAKLRVSFFGPLFLGKYWILDHDDGYQWSIVGEPSGRFLWILSRDPAPGQDVYQDLLSRAGALGYNVAMVRRTRQVA